MSGPTPVDVERIRSLLNRGDVAFDDYQDCELVVPTTNAVYFWNTANPQILQLRGQWRGVAGDDRQFGALAEQVAQCNATRTGPKAFLAPLDDGLRYGLVAECNAVAISGLTEDQLSCFCETSMGMIMSFFHDIEEALPEFVTWEDAPRAITDPAGGAAAPVRRAGGAR